MKKSRIQKIKNARETKPEERVITRQDMDRMIFDMVMGEIYEHADMNEMMFEDILGKYKVQLPERERQRLWDVLINTSWVSPKMGFGQAGKLELTQQGYQLMSQYGSYSNYVAATHMAMPTMQTMAAGRQDKQAPPNDNRQQDGQSEKKKEE